MNGKDLWDTPWGRIYLQTEGARGEGRYHFLQWHGSAKPPFGLQLPEGSYDRRTALRRAKRWIGELRPVAQRKAKEPKP
jgi:hypothetical protein